MYDTLASELAKEIHITDSTIIIIDKCKNKEEELFNFNERFLSNLNNPKNFKISLNHANSVSYNSLQMADLVAWSTFQNVEYKNPKFINIVENKVIKRIYED